MGQARRIAETISTNSQKTTEALDAHRGLIEEEKLTEAIEAVADIKDVTDQYEASLKYLEATTQRKADKIAIMLEGELSAEDIANGLKNANEAAKAVEEAGADNLKILAEHNTVITDGLKDLQDKRGSIDMFGGFFNVSFNNEVLGPDDLLPIGMIEVGRFAPRG